jgi:hypothetical protein
MDETNEFVHYFVGPSSLQTHLFELFVDFDALILDAQFLPDFVTADDTHRQEALGDVTQLPDEGDIAPAPPKNATSNPVSGDDLFGWENDHEGDQALALKAPSLPQEHEGSRSRRCALPSFN